MYCIALIVCSHNSKDSFENIYLESKRRKEISPPRACILGYSTSTKTRTTTLYVYDPQTDNWTQKASMKTARDHLSGVAVNNKIYAIGGWNGLGIEKSVNKNDKRVNVVSLTPKAKNLIKDMETMADDVTKKALEGLNDNDIQNLYKCLNQIINNLSKEGFL